MFLLIDPSVKDLHKIILFDEETVLPFSQAGRNRDLLISLDNYLRTRQVAVTDIRGVAVVVGVGGFTSTRLAVTIANTFAFVLNIPLLSVTAQEAMHPRNLIAKLSSQPRGQYISATYSGEANIGNRG